MNTQSNGIQKPLQGRTVLVVEDNLLQRAYMISLLTQIGAKITVEAANGVEGLHKLSQMPEIDLVFTDLEMPSMDGVTFISEFAARGFNPELILISAFDANVLHSVRLMAETYGMKVRGILKKPISMDDLLSLVNATFLTAPIPSFKPSMYQASAREIEEGIENNEFICYFQPQIQFATGDMTGVEALARWRHPVHGILGPAAFLPQLETNEPLISKLTEAILHHVSFQWQEWKSNGMDVEVSVNLSALSVESPGFADVLMSTVKHLDMDPRHLVLELTESASISDLGHSLANLARLRLRGFRLSIDDFGTGYATFQQLERIPFTEMKIDRSIVMRLPESHRHMAMAMRLVQMAGDLRLTTVAEGVETIEAWKALKGMDCQRGQGYLIARPMPGELLPEWASQDRSRFK